MSSSNSSATASSSSRTSTSNSSSSSRTSISTASSSSSRTSASGPTGPKQLRLHICGTPDDDDAAPASRIDSFGNACLDLFLLDAAATRQRLHELLAAAWDQDALTALKLVCHRRTVKRDTEGFLAAATWMLQAHPRVFADNLPAFAELGYVQDLAGLLNRLGSLVVVDGDRQRDAIAASREEATHVNLQPAPAPAAAAAGLKRARVDDDTSSSSSVPKRARHTVPSTSTAPVLVPPSPTAPEAADNDLPYHTLYHAMEEFFVDRLRSDLGHLDGGSTSMVSLAAHWFPNMGQPLDPTSLLRMDVARRLLPNTDDPKYLLLHLRQRVLDRLLVALGKQQQRQTTEVVRGRIQLPHLVAGKFGKERWEGRPSEDKDEIIEQWRTIVGDHRARGSLTNCIAVCDVSPGGLTLPGPNTKLLKVCVALGLLVAELGEEPWKDWVHAFSSGDVRHFLGNKATYADKVGAIRGLKCDGRFNLRKVFEWVLSKALQSKVEPRGMVRTIFVFTGKNFEQAIVQPPHHLRAEDRPSKYFYPNDVRRWRDDYRIVCHEFKQHGYEDCVPGVVLWNLMGERSAALTLSTDQHDGVLSLSGYSDEFLRLFLDKGGVVHAEDEMNDAIDAGGKYRKLQVRQGILN